MAWEYAQQVCKTIGHGFEDQGTIVSPTGHLGHYFTCQRCGEIKQEWGNIILGVKNVNIDAPKLRMPNG